MSPSGRGRAARFFRVDVRYMRRGELFKKSGQFLVAGGIAVALYLVLLRVAGLPAVRGFSGTLVGVCLIVLVLLAGMGLIGGGYLLARACFRSSAYDPHKIWAADEPSRQREASDSERPNL